MRTTSWRPSFASQLAVFWALVAFMCAVLISLVWFMAEANVTRQLAVARQSSLAACEAVASRYDLSTDPSQPALAPNTELMHAILDVVFAQINGVEGGFWRADAASPSSRGSFEAYAFPTYQGSGIKRDIPEAETPLILRTLRDANAAKRSTAASVTAKADAVVVAACPVAHHDGLFAWTLTRTHAPLGADGRTLVAVLVAMLTLIVAIAVWLGFLLRRWRANLARIEASLVERDDRFIPMISTGEPDLDKIVAAFNAYGERTTALQAQAGTLNERLVAAERFSALGRLAAQVAHEIRNPIGAMRLKAENALAGDIDRKDRALKSILEQIQRVETQLGALLALTQPVRVHIEAVPLAAWLQGRTELHRDAAQRANITLNLEQELSGRTSFPMDADQLARAVDNLLINALRHAPSNGHVTLRAVVAPNTLRLEVLDDGPGVPPEERERVFQPFVTGHAAGSGLGLAVVREIAAAHGGRAFYETRRQGACFVIEIPCQPS
ncbi:HAMP domain-containing sensor histidine kinase [Caballeronia sp. SBC2]|uniref:sensor histidine kinase n=1 Tax=Caballeronia sp. SBC2 TaxID=2705547 RepID=UPI0013E1F692|nr:HAMP domain-containing sensor histidine kinase [Caballeronia sp. SBC2]QIE29750.1 Adaptive-response sensory-kinase SasA [Caballeronia sp. SBC2]